MKRFILVCFILAAAVNAFADNTAKPTDWPNWRGVNLDSVYSGNDWNPAKLSASAVLWTQQIGSGYAAPSIQNGKLYIIGFENPNDVVRCLDAATGAKIWEYRYKSVTASDYPGTRASPCIDSGRVYTLSRAGELICLDANSGKLIWNVKLESLGARNPTWDMAGSPLVFGNLLVVNANKYGIAFNKATGAVVWKSPAGISGYASPVPFSFKGKEYLAFFGERQIYAVEKATGNLWWDYNWFTSYEVNAADPLVFDTKILIASGYGTGDLLLDFSSGKPVQVWKNRNFITHFHSFVFYKNRIFGLSGDAGDNRTSSFRCVNPVDGSVVWQQRLGYAGFIRAGEMFILLDQDGRMTICEASPDSYVQIAQQNFPGDTYWTAPVMANGRVYIRSVNGLLTCINLAK